MNYMAITMYFLSAIFNAATVTALWNEGLGHSSKPSLFTLVFTPINFSQAIHFVQPIAKLNLFLSVSAL